MMNGADGASSVRSQMILEDENKQMDVMLSLSHAAFAPESASKLTNPASPHEH